MRCEEIQKLLGLDAQPSRLPAGARDHIYQCPACRQVQEIYESIDGQLRELPAWHPPTGFVERVGMQGPALISEARERSRAFYTAIPAPSVAPISTPLLLGLFAMVFCLLVLINANAIAAAYPNMVGSFSKALIENIGQIAWGTGILSLGFSAWVTRRALR